MRKKKMEKARIVVHRFSDIPGADPNVRNFEVTRVISESFYESFRRPLRDKSEQYLERVGELGRRLVRHLISLPGVAEVMIGPYSISVKKGAAFDWEGEGGLHEAFVSVIREIVYDNAEVEIRFVLPFDDLESSPTSPSQPSPRRGILARIFGC